MIPGLEPDANTILTNKEILSLKEIPKSMVIIGAGAVGVEFASIYHRFGTKVTVLEMLPHAVPLEDEEISAELEKSLSQARHCHASGRESAEGNQESERRLGGIHQLRRESANAGSRNVSGGGGPRSQHARHWAGKNARQAGARIREDQSLHANRRARRLCRGRHRGGQPAAGPRGHMEGVVAVTHAAGKEAEPINYRQVPNCTYCEPEVASVGLTERQAREAGHKIKIGKFPFSANSKAGILGAREGLVKIVCDERYGEILGVHMIGPRVTEMIAEAVVAMRLEGTAEDLAHTIHAHPTLSEAVREAAHAAVDWAIQSESRQLSVAGNATLCIGRVCGCLTEN